MNKPNFCRNFFLIDWSYKGLKNTIDLLLFYGEDFYGFSEVIYQHAEQNIHFTTLKFFDILKCYEVLFWTYCKGLFYL